MYPRFDPDKLRDLLYLKIRQSRRTFRDLCRELGWPNDRVSRMLKGRAKIDLEDLYELLGALQITPSQFWEELHGPAWAVGQALAEIDLGPPPDPDEPVPGGLTWGELMGALQKVITEGQAIKKAREEGTLPPPRRLLGRKPPVKAEAKPKKKATAKAPARPKPPRKPKKRNGNGGSAP